MVAYSFRTFASVLPRGAEACTLYSIQHSLANGVHFSESATCSTRAGILFVISFEIEQILMHYCLPQKKTTSLVLLRTETKTQFGLKPTYLYDTYTTCIGAHVCPPYLNGNVKTAPAT